jgi:hypothetical protein
MVCPLFVRSDCAVSLRPLVFTPTYVPGDDCETPCRVHICHQIHRECLHVCPTLTQNPFAQTHFLIICAQYYYTHWSYENRPRSRLVAFQQDAHNHLLWLQYCVTWRWIRPLRIEQVSSISRGYARYHAGHLWSGPPVYFLLLSFTYFLQIGSGLIRSSLLQAFLFESGWTTLLSQELIWLPDSQRADLVVELPLSL